MERRTFSQHLDSPITPKRILALDGGGLRGVLTVAFLKKIEDLLRDQTGGGADFRLCDYYDLIGGTSTGSIIAAGLALGMSVDEIRNHYFKLGADVFKKSFFRRGITAQQYDAAAVGKALRGVFGDRTLGSSEFKTGLLIMTKRLDTGSPWPLTNNPATPYFHSRVGSKTVANKVYPLWAVVRASTAAPTYFEPELISIKAADAAAGLPEVEGEFVDGGVSPSNNPALQLVLTATVKGYGFCWPLGEGQLSVTSVGTGRASSDLGLSSGAESVAALHAVKALKSVLDDCENLTETVMQWMSRSPTARSIDRVMGALEGCHPGVGPCLTYLRYNVHFEQKWFRENFDLEMPVERLKDLARMDEPKNMEELERIGAKAADKLVLAEHFRAA